jgi:hypothetical protein
VGGASYIVNYLLYCVTLTDRQVASIHHDTDLEKQRLAFEIQKYEEEKVERLRLEAKADAERLRLVARADIECIKREQEFAWQQNHAAAESARQKAQFDWHRATAAAEKAAQEQQFAWQKDKEAREHANRTLTA